MFGPTRKMLFHLNTSSACKCLPPLLIWGLERVGGLSQSQRDLVSDRGFCSMISVSFFCDARLIDCMNEKGRQTTLCGFERRLKGQAAPRH